MNIERNVPQSNVTGPNKRNVVTVTIFGNLHEENKYHRYTWWSDCPPVCPPDSSSYFCPKNSICHRQKTLTHQVFVMKINHCYGQPSRLRHELTASVPARLTQGNTLKTHRRHHDVTVSLFRSCSASFLCEFHSGSSLRRRCFTLCESPSVENWWASAFIHLLLCNWGYWLVSVSKLQ